MTISSTLAQEMRRGIFESPILTLVKITHSLTPGVVRLVDNPVDIVSNGQTFTNYKLSVVTPKQSKDVNTDLTITLAMGEPAFLCQWFMRMPRTEAPLFTVQRVRAETPDVIEDEYADCPVISLNGTELDLTFLCRWETILGQPISRPMTRQYFPGLYRDA